MPADEPATVGAVSTVKSSRPQADSDTPLLRLSGISKNFGPVQALVDSYLPPYKPLFPLHPDRPLTLGRPLLRR